MPKLVLRPTAERIKEALRQAKGMAIHAAPLLGVSRRTMRRWMAAEKLETFATELRARYKATKPPPAPKKRREPICPRVERAPRKVRPPRPPKPPREKRPVVNPFRQEAKRGPKPKHVKANDPLASRSVTNRELRALGFWR